MKKLLKIIAFLVTISAFCAFASCSSDNSSSGSSSGSSDSSSSDSSESSGEEASSELTQTAEEIISSESSEEESYSEVPEDATEITGKITIEEAGNYYVDSVIEGKKITVECEGVTLYLSGATLSNEKKVIESTCSLTIVLIGDNYISNSNEDGSNAIDCEGDLTIKGDGTLNVYSTKNAIKGNSITVIGSTLVLEAEKDGLHAEVEAYDSAETEPEPSYDDGGYVYLSGADVSIESADDGIQADTFVYIADGSIVNITAGGGAPSTVTSTTSDNASGKGIKAGAIDWGADATDIEWEGYLVCIKDSEIIVDSNDDAIHSDGDIEISGGDITVSTGDDGVHADYTLAISGGSISVLKSYEGLEATYVNISGGNITVSSVDDGINAAGGADSSGFGGMDSGGWGPGNRTSSGRTFAAGVVSSSSSSSSDSSETPYISVSGGNIEIVSDADGLDSNGNITISGGEIYISGPVNGSDSAIDYDGTAKITGGIIIAVARSGMSQNFSSSSTQGSVLLTATSMSSGEVSVKDSSGNVLASYTPSKSYNCVLISCPGLVKGSGYTVTACGKSKTFTLSSLIYSVSM